MGFLAIDTVYLCKWNVKSGVSGHKHLTGDRLTYQNAHFYKAEFRLKYAWVCNNNLFMPSIP